MSPIELIQNIFKLVIDLAGELMFGWTWQF